MSLNSFYGGKQGISPIIKHSFKYVSEEDPAYKVAIEGLEDDSENKKAVDAETMNVCFSDPNYKEVWYNEYCIIDTPNKNNPNNGKLYRRTLKPQGSAGLYAEYIGQIVGPAGSNPFFSLGSLDDVKSQLHGEYTVNDDTVIMWPTGENSYSTEKPTDTEAAPHPFIANAENSMLVPGKYTENGESKFNDGVTYTWMNIVDNTSDKNLSVVYLGFQIPYPVLEAKVVGKDWDWEETENNPAIEKDDGGEHPFYHHWTVNIPRGVRGNASGKIRMAKYKEFFNTSTSESKQLLPYLYDFSTDVTEINTRGIYSLTSEEPKIPEALRVDSIATLDDDTENKYEAKQEVSFFVYDYTFYDTSYEDKRIQATFFLGTYDVVSDIELKEDGSVVFTYSNATTKQSEQKIKSINTITIDENGVLKLEYNTGDEASFQMPFPQDASIDDEGKIIFRFKHEDEPITITLKDGNDDFKLQYVDSISINEDTKNLSYTKYPSETPVSLNTTLNSIKAVTIDEDFHLLVLYTSTKHRITLEEYNDKSKDGKEITYIELPFTFKTNRKEALWDGRYFRDGLIVAGSSSEDFWEDFGSVKPETMGMKITTRINLDKYPEKDNVPSYSIDTFLERVLNSEYWNEEETISNPYYHGRISTNPTSEDPLKGTLIYTEELKGGAAFYFDYNTNKWQYFGTWGENTTIDVKISGEDYGAIDLSLNGVILLPYTNEEESSTILSPVWEEKE